MANLDLSSAFDVVNVKLLLKRMRIAGLPSDIVKLIEIWLVERRCFVTVNGKNSFIKMSDIGTVQGSILGPFIITMTEILTTVVVSNGHSLLKRIYVTTR